MTSRNFGSWIGFGVVAVALVGGAAFLMSTAPANAPVDDVKIGQVAPSTPAADAGSRQIVVKAGWEYTVLKGNTGQTVTTTYYTSNGGSVVDPYNTPPGTTVYYTNSAGQSGYVIILHSNANGSAATGPPWNQSTTQTPTTSGP